MAFLFTKAKSLIPQWFLAEPTDAQKAIPDQSGKVGHA